MEMEDDTPELIVDQTSNKTRILYGWFVGTVAFAAASTVGLSGIPTSPSD